MGNQLAQSKAPWPNDGKHIGLANPNVGHFRTVQGVPLNSVAESLVQTDQSHLFRQGGLTGAEAVSGLGPKLALHMRNMFAC